MSKVTSKFQVSIPKSVAERAGIRIGDELDWEVLDGELRVRRASLSGLRLSVEERLKLFDEQMTRLATIRAAQPPRAPAPDRGWTREELYDRDLHDRA